MINEIAQTISFYVAHALRQHLQHSRHYNTGEKSCLALQ